MTEPWSIGAARVLAPEDIAPGQYVATLYRVYEYPARCWDSDLPARDVGTVRWRAMDCDGPYRVLSVCLPLVLVADKDGETSQLDVRDTVIARLSDEYGQRAFRKEGAAPDEPDWVSLRGAVLKHLGAK